MLNAVMTVNELAAGEDTRDTGAWPECCLACLLCCTTHPLTALRPAQLFMASMATRWRVR